MRSFWSNCQRKAQFLKYQLTDSFPWCLFQRRDVLCFLRSSRTILCSSWRRFSAFLSGWWWIGASGEGWKYHETWADRHPSGSHWASGRWNPRTPCQKPWNQKTSRVHLNYYLELVKKYTRLRAKVKVANFKHRFESSASFFSLIFIYDVLG